MTASVRDVASLAGVSVGTVSNVLNARPSVSPSVAERVHAAIAELGYVPNAAARQLRAGQSRTLALVVLDVTNPFFAEVARGAEDRAAESGYVVLVGSTQQDAERESAYIDQFRQQRVAGVALALAPGGTAVDDLRAAGIPAVQVGATTSDPDLPSVSVDDVRGGEVAAAHLLSQGRRTLTFIGGPLTIPQVRDRLAGVRRAITEHPSARLEVVELDEMTVAAGRAAASDLLRADARPDAVIGANDLLALGALHAITAESSLRVPTDIALVGYDDIDFAATAIVPLSSVRQPARALGQRAVDILLNAQRDSGHHVVFQPELVVRASSGGVALSDARPVP